MRIINVNNVKKVFEDIVVFNEFSMEVNENEFVVISGESGSGKSTLLNMLGLLDKPDKGEITLFNLTNVKPFSRAAEKLLKDRIGYLFQNYALVEDKTVLYNLQMALEHYKIKNKDERISNALKHVGLEGFENKRVFQCSGGEQQRVAMARLLVKPCDLILADEPTGSLDADNKQKIFELLKKFQSDGKTIVVVTHDQDLLNIADRVIKIGSSN